MVRTLKQGVQRLLGVAAWSNGRLHRDYTRIGPVPDAVLSVEWLGEANTPGLCTLQLSLVPRIVHTADAAGQTHVVRSFRYLRFSGHTSELLHCGSCGHVIHCASEELRDLVVADAACPVCQAGPTKRSCVRFHQWGQCTDCAGDVPQLSAPVEPVP